MSCDHRLFWEFLWHEKWSYKNFISHYIYVWLVLFSPCPSCLFSIIPPWSHWRCERSGVTREGWKAWDAFKEMSAFYTVVHTWIHTWKCLGAWIQIPGSGKGFQIKNEKEIFSAPPESCQNSYFASFSLCKKPLHFPDRGSSDPAVSIPGAPATAAAAGAERLWQPGRKDLVFAQGFVQPFSSEGRGYLQTFCELSRLESGLNLRLFNLQHMWLSCVSKLDKWSSSDLGFNTNSAKCTE